MKTKNIRLFKIVIVGSGFYGASVHTGVLPVVGEILADTYLALLVVAAVRVAGNFYKWAVKFRVDALSLYTGCKMLCIL